MASIFGHAVAATTLTKTFPRSVQGIKIILLAIFCAVIPDADVLMFKLGFSYDHWLGHRGFFHSIFFSVMLGFLVSFIFFKRTDIRLLLALLFSFAAISHGCLDALTNGGRGVAFFAPFDHTRYFFPWRPIQVSPIGVSRFFSEWGLIVLKSEAIFIGIPCLIIWILARTINNFSGEKDLPPDK